MTLDYCIVSAFAAAALIASAPATALDTAGQSPARESEENKVVCKSQAKTGTRFKEKDCRTRAQWEELRVQQQRDAEEMINRPKICGGGGSKEGC